MKKFKQAVMDKMGTGWFDLAKFFRTHRKAISKYLGEYLENNEMSSLANFDTFYDYMDPLVTTRDHQYAMGWIAYNLVVFELTGEYADYDIFFESNY